MSDNEDAENRGKKREKIDRKINSRKEKKRKRKTTDQSEDTVGSKTPQIEGEEIADDGAEGVEKKPKEPSKRKQKRDNMEKRFAEQREASKLQAAQKALTYISKWKHAKSDWRFEKLRQIWLMDHLLDEESVPDSIFPIALEYFEGCKGMARQQLVKKMMDVIKKAEELNENEKTDGGEENEATNNAEYQRARQILQALPTES